MDACRALRADDVFARPFGQQFVDYILTLKEFEISRFLSEVTDWEHQEYFGLF